MAEILLVKNWRRFQHYRDRNPPWIKLHFELLSSRDWCALDDASRVLAVACMLVASRTEGVIEADEAGIDYLKRVGYLNTRPNFIPLIQCGFLDRASTGLQMQAQARPETETETEKDKSIGATAPPDVPRGTKRKKQPPLGEIALPDWLPANVWADFVKMRVAIRKPLTQRAAELIILEVGKLSAAGHDPVAVLNGSIRNSWQDVFPPKDKTANGSGNGRYAPAPPVPATPAEAAANTERVARSQVDSENQVRARIGQPAMTPSEELDYLAGLAAMKPFTGTAVPIAANVRAMTSGLFKTVAP